MHSTGNKISVLTLFIYFYIYLLKYNILEQRKQSQISDTTNYDQKPNTLF